MIDLGLCFVFGALGYCLTWLFARLTSRRTLPAQHAEIRDRVLSLLTRLIEVEQERLFCEHELYRIREAAPDPEALWIVHSLEQVRMLPPVLTQLAKRFGFKVPDADNEQPNEEPATAWGDDV